MAWLQLTTSLFVSVLSIMIMLITVFPSEKKSTSDKGPKSRRINTTHRTTPPIKHELFLGLSVPRDQRCHQIRAVFQLTDDALEGKANTSSDSRHEAFAPPAHKELSSHSCPKDRVISEGEFRAFIEEEVVPRFPLGFSVLSGEGYYAYNLGERSGKSGGAQTSSLIPVREESKILVVLDLGGEEEEQSSDDVIGDDEEFDTTTEAEQDVKKSIGGNRNTPSSLVNRVVSSISINVSTLQSIGGMLPSSSSSSSQTRRSSSSGRRLKAVEQALIDIAGMYRWYFQQESVLWVQTPAARADFI